METNKKLFYLVEELLQAIAKTQKNLGEMHKLQKEQDEMNHKILQDSIRLQNEVKDILVVISNGKDNDLLKKHSSDQSTNKHQRSKESKVIENGNPKRPLQCWGWGGNHLIRDFPINNSKKIDSHNRLVDN